MTSTIGRIALFATSAHALKLTATLGSDDPCDKMDDLFLSPIEFDENAWQGIVGDADSVDVNQFTSLLRTHSGSDVLFTPFDRQGKKIPSTFSNYANNGLMSMAAFEAFLAARNSLAARMNNELDRAEPSF